MTKEKLKPIDVSKYKITETGHVLKRTEERKQGYQPMRKRNRNSAIPPNTGSHVHMKKDGYIWEDMDKSYWEGFDTAKNNMEKRIIELETTVGTLRAFSNELATCIERLKEENAYKRKSETEWRLNELYQKSLTDFANAEKCSREYFTRYRDVLDHFIKAKEIIKNLIDTFDIIDGEQTRELKDVKDAEQFLKECEIKK